MGVSEGAVRMSESACPVCGDPVEEGEDPKEREMADQWWAATRNPDGTPRDQVVMAPDRDDPDGDEDHVLADAQL